MQLELPALRLPGSAGLNAILSLSFTMKTDDTIWRKAKFLLLKSVSEPLAHGPYFPIRGLVVSAPSRIIKQSSTPVSFRSLIVISSRKFSGACIFQVQDVSSEPSGNSGVEISPGTLASMTMFVFDGEQTGIKSKHPFV